MKQENLPKRKRLRLQNYDYSSNGLYFVTLCVKNKNPIFSKIVGDDAYKFGNCNSLI